MATLSPDSTHVGRAGQPLPAHLEALIARGFHLFPIYSPDSSSANGCTCKRKECGADAGKHPRCKNGVKDATNDRDKVSSWFKRMPGCNWGIACGPSGIVVIDEDLPGELKRYAEDNRIPEIASLSTLTIETTRGRHLYFKADPNLEIGRPGFFRSQAYEIDVKGAGGYVVASGSLHESGTRYRVAVDTDLIFLPEALSTPLARRDSSAGHLPRLTGIAHGKNYATTAYGQAALTGELENLRHAENGNRNNQLNNAAYKIGCRIAEGSLTTPIEDVKRELFEVADEIGLVADDGADRVMATIESGLKAGLVEGQQKHMAAKKTASSWAPVDLTSLFDGTFKRKEPTVLARSDGQPLIYPGAMNSIYGEPESGKSWVFLLAAKEVMERPTGDRVLLIDFESDSAEIFNRLRVLGTSVETIRDRFVFVQPEERPHRDDPRLESLLSGGFTLVGIDGITACLAVFGYRSDSGDDFASWTNEFPRRFSRSGASVLMMDHVTKSQDGRGRFPIGSQIKLGLIDGAAFSIEMTNVFGRGLRGEAAIRLTKDRSGALHAKASEFRKGDRTQEIGRLVIDATDEPNVSGEIHPPGTKCGAVEVSDSDTALQERVSIIIEEHPGIQKAALLQEIGGSRKLAQDAIAYLIDHKFVREGKVRKACTHTSVKPYREPSDIRTDLGGA